MRKIRIVYNIAGTFNAGGMERVLANKANYLSKNGFQVYILTTDQQGRSSYFSLDPDIRQYDLDINYAEGQGLSALAKMRLYREKQKKHKRALSDMLAVIQADVVISMFDHDVSFLYKLKDGSRKVLEIHFSRFKRLQYGRRGIWRLLDAVRSRMDLYYVKKYDRFVVLTEEDRGYWGDLANIEVIPNANSFSYSGQALLQAKRAIAIGRFDQQKAFDKLISIWFKIRQDKVDWELHIYGHGQLKKVLEQQIHDLGLQDLVKLKAPVSNISSVYLDSSVLLMTSRYEGLPMVLLEAQAHGLPLIAYACRCGPADVIVDNVNGFLIPEGEEQLFVKRTIEIMQDQNKRLEMGRQSKALSVRFDETRVMNKWIDLFNELTIKKG